MLNSPNLIRGQIPRQDICRFVGIPNPEASKRPFFNWNTPVACAIVHHPAAPRVSLEYWNPSKVMFSVQPIRAGQEANLWTSRA